MNEKEIIKELREILKVYHYDNKLDMTQEQHIGKDIVIRLENLLGSLLK